MVATETGATYVKINRVTSGWTWNIQVAASGNTLEELQDVKNKALQLNQELSEQFLPVTDVEPSEDDLGGF